MKSFKAWKSAGPTSGSDQLVRGLCLCFGVSWIVAVHHPVVAVTCLGGTCSLLTIPYFLRLFGARIARNLLVALGLTILGTIVPVLLPFVAFWALYCLLDKLSRLLSNLPLIVAGVAAYEATAHAPAILFQLIEPHFSQAPGGIADLLVGFIGALCFWTAIRIAVMLGSAPVRSAAFMLGCGSYLTLFVLSFLIPHIDGGDGPD